MNERCVDIDECKDSTNPCDQKCTNTEGSYMCDCWEGYRLDFNDRKTCSDVNECTDKTSKCQQTCINQPGNYSCDCWEGYALSEDGFTCRAAFDTSDLCYALNCQQTCDVVGNGKAECACYEGYERNQNDTTSCYDIDECKAGNMPCSQVCINTDGKFQCSCYTGYELEADGVSCSFCQKPYYGKNCTGVCQCNTHGTCDPVRGCVCEKQWTGSNCERDVDECQQDNACPAGQVCKNEMGSYSCKCPDGYRNNSGNCEDINECVSLQVTAACDLHVEICQNTVGSYRCDCLPGYARNLGNCADIDECAVQTDVCEQDCENVPGSYNCKCPRGSRLGPDRRSCMSGREMCLSVNLNCSHGCAVDDNDQPYCTCPRGYQLNGKETCKDIDECSEYGKNKCTYKAGCRNTEGNYKCSCPVGSKLDNDGRSCDNCTGETWGLECANSCACGFGTDHCDLKMGCVCKSGFTGNKCSEDIDECKSGQQQCKPKEECVNLPGNATCRCQQGYSLKQGMCVDIDECDKISTNDCSQKCTNTEGSYACSCFPGYTMNAADKTCIDVDECALTTSQCEDDCINTEGSYRCSCSNGLLLQPDGLTCDSTLPCPSNNTCSDQCVMINGTEVVCQCPRGKSLSPTNSSLCEDVDLCDHSNCSFGCTETKGNTSFQCVCDIGQKLAADGFTCTDCIKSLWGVNCANQCHCEASNTKSCNKVNGTCNCKTGWTGTNCSEDIDECKETTNPCDRLLHTTCNNTDGAYVCACSSGYFKRGGAGDTCEECHGTHYGPSCTRRCICGPHEVCDKINGSCYCSQEWEGPQCELDIDECDRGLHHCNKTLHEQCSNTQGGYSCDCQTGYERKCSTCECTDIDECNNPSTLKCSQICINVDGGFNCSCNPGYVYNATDNTCTDIDECRESITNNCTQGCTNVDGGFSCSCHPGYVYNATDNTCHDIDECSDQNSNNCTHVCTNVDGGFNCSCSSGYIYNASDNTCKDIDECTDPGTHNCTQVCTNVDGGFNCSCDPGYIYNASDNSCNDIDECSDTHNCTHICINVDGGFNCSCQSGYVYNASDNSCNDCMENSWGTNCANKCNCEASNTKSCNKVNGTCTCKTGWAGPSCTEDINECEDTPDPCDGFLHTTCTNTNGSFVCTCSDGYKKSGAGDTCEDVDECLMELDTCVHDCINTEGGYRCSCLPGYEENGAFCRKISVSTVTTTFDFDASKVDLSEGSDDYKQLATNIQETMKKSLMKTGLAVLSVRVLSLKKGSLIATSYVEIDADKEAQPEEALAQSLIQIRDDVHFTMNNQTAAVTKLAVGNTEFSASDSLCEIKQKGQPCPDSHYCVEEREVTICKPTENDGQEDDSLFLGLWIGIPLFILACGVIGISTYCLVTKRKKGAKTGENALDRLRSERENHFTGREYRKEYSRENSVGFSGYHRGEGTSAVNQGYMGSDVLHGRSRSGGWMDNVLISRPASLSVPAQEMEMSDLRDVLPYLPRHRTEPAEFRTDYRMQTQPREATRRPPDTSDDQAYYQYHGNGRVSRLYDGILNKPYRIGPTRDY